ncbi:arylsulfatase B-like isoform X2 [Macrobrachium rosenbergii]|uniref:arylsulfatase B-like isoform X2 n=1 Tax=Macrobrachium rosenbergii TaxID=79674 RepID=UPI0034D661A4
MIFAKVLLVIFFSIRGSHSLKDKADNETSRPHILLIVADDLGWNDVSWHNDDVLTPNLKKLAIGGVRLNRSYVLPICTPTRSALLTGRYPFTIGRQKSTLRPSEPTGLTLNATLLPQALRDAGYSTHAVGKWHLGYCSWAYTPTYRGFDTFYGYYNGAENYLTHMRGNLNDPHFLGDSDEDFDSVSPDKNPHVHEYLDFRNNTEPDPREDGTYSTHLFASYVENLLESRNPADPMFLYLPFQSVHAPLMVPENYTKPYRHIRDKDRRIYLGMVTALDEAVGRITDALKRTGHYENSVIVFTTDNGGTWKHGGNNWPLRGMKSSLWEGGTRGAAFVHSPLLPNPGTVSDKLIHATDWFPTLARLGGAKAPSDTDGFDQWNSITGNEHSPRVRMVYNIDNTEKIRASVRIGNYKLIVGYPGKDDWFPPPELKGYVSPRKLSRPNVPLPKGFAEFSEKDKRKRAFFSSADGKKQHKLKRFRNKHRVKNHFHSKVKGSFEEIIHKEAIMSNEVFSRTSASHDPNDDKDLWGGQSTATWGLLLNEHFGTSGWLDEWPQASEIFRNETEIRLYDVANDPEERNDLATKKIHKVKTLLEFVLEELANRYVPADIKPFDPEADPKHWNNVFSPGWCKTE